MYASLIMKITRIAFAILQGWISEKLAPPEAVEEAKRVHRRLTKFQRLHKHPNPQALRTLIFKRRFNIA